MGKHGTGKVLKACMKCQKEFYARVDKPGLFCSKSCAGMCKIQKTNKIKKICLICLTEFIVKGYRKDTAKYCSSDCRRKNMPSGKRHVDWKGGISERPYKVRKKIKKLIALKNFCNECGKKEVLQGHHIKPYSEFPELGCDDENIVVLCCYCHALKHPDIKDFILKGVNNEREMDTGSNS